LGNVPFDNAQPPGLREAGRRPLPASRSADFLPADTAQKHELSQNREF